MAFEFNRIQTNCKTEPLRVLIVDDDREILSLLSEAFNGERWKVFTATDGTLALRIMSTEKFDAILSDMAMPRMGGIEFLGFAKGDNLNKKAKLFIISGTLDCEKLKRVTAVGVASVIIK